MPPSGTLSQRLAWTSRTVGTFGPDRLMFASDWTNSEPMSTFGELVALDRAYFGPKGHEVMEKVFWKNSLSAYRWKKRRANQPSLA